VSPHFRLIGHRRHISAVCSAFAHFIFRSATDKLGATPATAFAVTADSLERRASQHDPRNQSAKMTEPENFDDELFADL
jgi:hypothetical protein